jgi:Bacterial protein of unknown function (DUF885)
VSLEALTARYLEHHLEYHPVNASFMGLDGHDHRLPPADFEARERELSGLRNLEREVVLLEPGPNSAERLELKMLHAQIRVATFDLEHRPRFFNPTWFTGESAFGLISLLLPSDPPRVVDDLRQRLEAMPEFLASGQSWLKGWAIPSDWVLRAKLEAAALLRLLEQGLKLHPLWDSKLEPATLEAIFAVKEFAVNLEHHADTDPACGEAQLEFLMREAHGLPFSPNEAENLALEGFQQANIELERMAAKLDPTRDWRTQLKALELGHPELENVIPTYERLHAQTLDLADATGLITPARDYSLQFQTLPEWARAVAGDLYFLFYRSPAFGRASSGSTYWVFPPGADLNAYLRSQNNATIKITHIVHHGSIGHHTQNARARESILKIGQIAGTDCASGIAMLSGGTMIEGWACYVQDLMLEVEGFYTPQETMLLKQYEMRNAAMCLADIRLHRGVWNLEQMRAFYRDQVEVPPARLWAETTRNSIYPATRLMYWLGTRAIKGLRQELAWKPREFHDLLLSFGSVPVAWVAEELRQQNQTSQAPDNSSNRQITGLDSSNND